MITTSNTFSELSAVSEEAMPSRSALRIFFVVLLCLSFASISSGQDKSEDVDALFLRLMGQKEGPGMTQDEFSRACARVVDALVSDPKGLASSDLSEIRNADERLQRLCFHVGRPGAEAERLAMSKALASKLTDDTPTQAREYILKHLERLGGKECAPAVARLLGAKEQRLREKARRALENNPSAAALGALRAALPKAEGAFRIAIINSLGARRDAESVNLLIGEARGADEPVRIAAIEALARIGEPAALEVLTAAMSDQSKKVSSIARKNCLLFASNIAAKGHTETALKIYRQMLDGTENERCAAVIGLGSVGGQAELPTIFDALGSDNKQVRGAALAALEAMEGKQVTAAIADKAKNAPPALKVGLLALLARRGDADALPLFIAAAKDEDEKVRIEAIEGIGKLGDERGVQTLLEALRYGEDRKSERDAAERAINSIPGKAAADAITQALRTETNKDARCILTRVLGYRNDPTTLSTLTGAANDKEEAVRIEAFKAIGRLGRREAMPTVLSALRSADMTEDERKAAEYALRRMRGKEATAAMIKAIEGAPEPLRVSLLRILGLRDDPAVIPLLLEGAKDSSENVQLAAYEGLARTKDPRALPVLKDAALNGSEKVRPIASRGCMRFADEMRKEKKEDAVKIYLSVLQTANRDEERRMALRSLGSVGDPIVLDKIKPYMKNRKLQLDAAKAMAAIADKLPRERRLEAIDIYTDVMKLNIDYKFATHCVEQLRKRGFKADYARDAGFVTFWWVIGPFPNPNGSMWDKALPPEKEVNIKAKLRVNGKTYKWKPYHTPDVRGIVDLEAALASRSSVGGYMYAEVTSQTAQDVLFKIGSDDQVACWLNGKRIHANRVNRGITPDQDVVKTRLEAGVNSILMKVLNDTGGWAACLRITDRKSQPVKLEQREVKIDLARDAGFVTFWWVIGPFPNPNGSLWEKALPPEKEVNLEAKIKVGGKEYAWNPYHTPDIRGVVDLANAIAPRDNVGGYIYAEVTAPKAQDVLFKIGSDDQVVCWLNGKKIHANRVRRAVAPDQDVVKTRLEAGVNKILMKILNDGGPWGGCLRVTNREHQPLNFKQREK